MPCTTALLSPLWLTLLALALAGGVGVTEAGFPHGSNPALADPGQFLSSLFRHASVGYGASTKGWSVPPALNWVVPLGIVPEDQGGCGEWGLGLMGTRCGGGSSVMRIL